MNRDANLKIAFDTPILPCWINKKRTLILVNRNIPPMSNEILVSYIGLKTTTSDNLSVSDGHLNENLSLNIKISDANFFEK